MPNQSAQEQRAGYLWRLAARSAARLQSPRLWLAHLAAQLRRAVPPGHGPSCRQLACGEQALRRGDFDEARRCLFDSLEHFPWQREELVPWTDELHWQVRHPGHDARRHPFVRRAGAAACLEPTDAAGPHDLTIIPGNRAHLSCREWQDPVFLGRRITEYAEGYTRRYMDELSEMFGEAGPGRGPRVLGLVCPAVASRHENRLEHFKLYQDPRWTHPRIVPTARAIFLPVFGREEAPGRWVRKAEHEIEAAPPFRTLTYSIGGTVSEQLFNEAWRIADGLGVPPAAANSYFARCAGVYVGGYQSDNLRIDLPLTRYLLVSFLDENVVGSPDFSPEAGGDDDVSFTTPLRLPDDPWKRLSGGDIAALLDGQPLQCRALPLARLRGGNIRLGVFAGELARDSMDAPHAEIMRTTRFGHRIPPQITAIKRHYPELVADLTAFLTG